VCSSDGGKGLEVAILDAWLCGVARIVTIQVGCHAGWLAQQQLQQAVLHRQDGACRAVNFRQPAMAHLTTPPLPSCQALCVKG
jgi:hypothetical protein